MIELSRGRDWIIATLTASSAFTTNAPGGVHSGLAPTGTPTPYCVVTVQSGGVDVAGVAGIRLFTTPLYQVRVFGPATQYAAIVAAADAADAVLQRAHGTTADGTIMSCIRQSGLAIDEIVGTGVQWSSLGGLYRLQVRPS